MHSSVNIMGIDVDMLSNEEFVKKTDEFLSDDRMNVILFASPVMLSKAAEDEEYRRLLNVAELLLPGDMTLLTAHHVDILENGGMFVGIKSMEICLESLRTVTKGVYILSDREKESHALLRWVKKRCPELNIMENKIYFSGLSDEAVVNDINIHTPDILILDMHIGDQERWLEKNAGFLSAKLCFAMGGISDIIIQNEKGMPKWLKKVTETIKKNRFHRKIKDYNKP